MGRHADALDYRQDAPKGVNHYCYETVPRLYADREPGGPHSAGDTGTNAP
jgi:hypothetical protein